MKFICSMSATLFSAFVGDAFLGFGGSHHALVAGRDFATGEKQKKPTASLIVRMKGKMGVHDTEYAIDDRAIWGLIARCINGEIPGIKAETR